MRWPCLSFIGQEARPDLVAGAVPAVTADVAAVAELLFSANRIGKVFVDYLRNGRGSTTACAFSVRARPGLGVSTPISWEQLDEITASNEFNIMTAQSFLKKQKKDPWSGYEKSRQSLLLATKALTALKR